MIDVFDLLRIERLTGPPPGLTSLAFDCAKKVGVAFAKQEMHLFYGFKIRYLSEIRF